MNIMLIIFIVESSLILLFVGFCTVTKRDREQKENTGKKNLSFDFEHFRDVTALVAN